MSQFYFSLKFDILSLKILTFLKFFFFNKTFKTKKDICKEKLWILIILKR